MCIFAEKYFFTKCKKFVNFILKNCYDISPKKYVKSISVSLKNIVLYEIPVFRYKNIPMQKNTCFAVSPFRCLAEPEICGRKLWTVNGSESVLRARLHGART